MTDFGENTSEQAALRLLRTVPGALCTILNVDGSFSRSPGAQLAIGENGQLAGSLSDGCLERELANQAARARSSNRAIALRYGAGSPFIDFRLPCGAGIDVLVDPFPSRAEIDRVCAELDARRSVAMSLPAVDTFGPTARAFDPALRLLAFGKGPELPALVRVSEAAGIEVEARVAGAPGLALGRPPSGCVADTFTAVVLLFHDHEWEEQILRWALTTSAFYIGSIGGSLARQMRRERLSKLGADPAEIARIRSPIGIIPSARDPMTLAVSILAEIVAADQKTRRQRPLIYPRYGGAEATAA